jgi:hypothetical protein
MHRLRRYHHQRPLSIVTKAAVTIAAFLFPASILMSGCATPSGEVGARRGAAGEPPALSRAETPAAAFDDPAPRERAAPAQGGATGAEVELQCLLPTALAYPDTVRAPAGELAAFMESIGRAAGPAEKRADLAAEVDAGRRAVANAAWWGFEAEDATAALQAAIDSPAQAVFVPAMGEPWRVEPIRLRGDLVLLLEEGAEVVAKRGSFIKRNDTLMSVRRAENIIIWGYGATLRMRKEDYSSWPYAESEFRHALRFRSVSNLGVYGLRIEEAGGDGIYLGRSGDEKPYCENVVIRDVVLESGNRQGLSIVSARRVLIEHSTFSNTKGTLPQAGIDFEPNKPDEYLEDILVRDSLFFRNRGAGIQFFLWNMTEDSPPISVRIENSELRGNLVDFYVARAGGNPTGRIEVVDSRIGWRRWVSTPPGLEVVYE